MWQAQASPVTRVCFRGQRVHIKRDDIFHLAGNKMRKLYWYLQQNDAFYDGAHFFSFGGTQSNAMLAIAQLAAAKHVPFTYFSRQLDIPRSPQCHNQNDNLSVARTLGMHHYELSTNEYHNLAASKDLADVVQRFLPCPPTKSLYIPQGAAFVHAEHGVRVLAEELNEYCQTYNQDTGKDPVEFSIVVPCGTGTTAFYLAQHVDPSLHVLAVPCVGDADYLDQQLDALAALHPDRSMIKPELLVPSYKARFGRLSRLLFDMYHELRDTTGIEFDLLYAAFAWQTLFEPYNLTRARGKHRELLYVHTGGVSGNGSMLTRYQMKSKLT